MLDQNRVDELVEEVNNCRVWLNQHWEQGGELDARAQEIIDQKFEAELTLEEHGFDTDGTKF